MTLKDMLLKRALSRQGKGFFLPINLTVKAIICLFWKNEFYLIVVAKQKHIKEFLEMWWMPKHKWTTVKWIDVKEKFEWALWRIWRITKDHEVSDILAPYQRAPNFDHFALFMNKFNNCNYMGQGPR
jgi:hypothetical protein